MNAFTIKIIALVSMLIDHAGAIMPEAFSFAPYGANIFRVIGRVAFPIFVYLIAEGFRHTKSPWKFLVRLGAFAIISEIPYDIAFNNGVNFLANTNIFYTLFLGGTAIFAWETLIKIEKDDNEHEEQHRASKLREVLATARIYIVAIVPLLGAMWLAELLTADYGAYGVLFIFIMYIIRPMKWRLAAMVVLCVWQHVWILEHVFAGGYVPMIHWLMFPATLLPVILFALYNGKRGPGLKWLFYLAYPVHLLIFVAIVFIFF